jgi:hypothetical protein
MPLKGIKGMHIFHFFVDCNGCLVFQYKASMTGVKGLLQGVSAHLWWRAISKERPIIPMGNVSNHPLACAFIMENTTHY